MKSTGRVTIYKNAELELGEGWKLCLQLVHFPNGYDGYRLIHKDAKGCLRSARGQTGINSKGDTDKLWEIAIKEGWGNYDLSKTKIEIKTKTVSELVAAPI